MRTYAIGDIHGQFDMLRHAHALIEADRRATGDAAAPVVHIGDLVDRGPDSAGVVEFLCGGVEQGQPWVVLKGNHDRLFLGFLSDMRHRDPMLRSDLEWLHPRLGGSETLASYGVPDAWDRRLVDVHAEALAAVPSRHRAFLTRLPDRYLRGRVLYVHAGIRPGVSLARQVEDDLLWIRGDFLNDPRDHGVLVVHGHTALEQPTYYRNRLNIDSGAGYGRPLTAVVLEERRVHVLTDAGRVPLLPVEK